MEETFLVYFIIGITCLVLGWIIGYQIRQESFDDLEESKNKLHQKYAKEIVEEKNRSSANFQNTISEKEEIISALTKERDNSEKSKWDIQDKLKKKQENFLLEKTSFNNLIDNPAALSAFALIKSGKNVFVHGKPGTGKSYFIKEVRKYLKSQESNLPQDKRGKLAILAPTGLSALNIKGQTIHSYFRINPDNINEKAEGVKLDNLETLIIDEISMVRSDLLDKIHERLCIAKNSKAPFGRLQLIFLGDIYQLDPVVKESEQTYTNKDFIKIYGKENSFFFNAKIWPEISDSFKHIQFNNNFRQNDAEFIKNLDIIRTKKSDRIEEALSYFNECYEENYLNKKIIQLCVTREEADTYNQECLSELNAKQITFSSVFSKHWYGTYKDKETGKIQFNAKDLQAINNLSYKTKKALTDSDPAPVEIDLKEGARIIFTDNDQEGRWVNGTIGTIEKINCEGNDPYLIVLTDKGEHLFVTQKTWYKLTKNKFGEQVEAKNGLYEKSFKQFPLQLAWAITIHKSQGATLTSAAIKGKAFANGQIYVALSRIKEKRNIHLLTKIEANDIRINKQVDNFLASITFAN